MEDHTTQGLSAPDGACEGQRAVPPTTDHRDASLHSAQHCLERTIGATARGLLQRTTGSPSTSGAALPRLAATALLVGSNFAVAAAPASAASAPMTDALTIPPGYQLVWSDEFAKDGLPDPAKWAYDTGMNKAGWHNAELQYYSDARPENSVVRGGKLIITARKEDLSSRADWGGQKYSSVRLITQGKADWTYGYFEIRAKLPCGKGTWPAIWMLNTPVVWPAGGEIDIVEHIGREPGHVFSTLHTADGHGGQGTGNGTQVPDACTAFHDYQLHWTPQQMRFGIDGKVHHVYRNAGKGTSQWPFDTPEFLILNIAIGGHLGGPVDDSIFPVQMEVEHVRVYQAPR
jgi:beta-glucanase (GH16 family)